MRKKEIDTQILGLNQMRCADNFFLPLSKFNAMQICDPRSSSSKKFGNGAVIGVLPSLTARLIDGLSVINGDVSNWSLGVSL